MLCLRNLSSYHLHSMYEVSYTLTKVYLLAEQASFRPTFKALQLSVVAKNQCSCLTNFVLSKILGMAHLGSTRNEKK